MKKITTILITAALLLSLCACGDYVSLMPGSDMGMAQVETEEFTATTLSELLGWQEFISSYYDKTPVAVSFTGAEGFASPIFDRESIIKACDALRSVTVMEMLGDAPEGTKADARYTFTMSDGTTYSVEFAGGELLYRSELYSVGGGEALESLAFPGYGGDFTVFDLYYDSRVTAFADSFETNTPVSVGRRANGGAVLSSQEAEKIAQVFELFATAEIESVETRPDQNIDLNSVQDYVFTLPDGSTQTFTVTGGCLAVQANSAYGTVYYHVSNLDELSAMSIATGSITAAFEGGMLGDLRNDIGRAVRAANGEYVAPENEADRLDQVSRDEYEDESESDSSESGEGDGLTVAGVYVSFDLDGTQDYISITGDEAEEFVRLMGEIEVSSERLTAAPEGGSLTVSVNLSDWSGPICYFAGGAAQQTVGNWYVCTGSGYDAMCSRVLEIYWDQMSDRDIDGTEE